MMNVIIAIYYDDNHHHCQGMTDGSFRHVQIGAAHGMRNEINSRKEERKSHPLKA
jgi:hypothetical protein